MTTSLSTLPISGSTASKGRLPAVRVGVLLEQFSLAWMVVEAVVAIGALTGARAGRGCCSCSAR